MSLIIKASSEDNSVHQENDDFGHDHLIKARSDYSTHSHVHSTNIPVKPTTIESTNASLVSFTNEPSTTTTFSTMEPSLTTMTRNTTTTATLASTTSPGARVQSPRPIVDLSKVKFEPVMHKSKRSKKTEEVAGRNTGARIFEKSLSIVPKTGFITLNEENLTATTSKKDANKKSTKTRNTRPKDDTSMTKKLSDLTRAKTKSAGSTLITKKDNASKTGSTSPISKLMIIVKSNEPGKERAEVDARLKKTKVNAAAGTTAEKKSSGTILPNPEDIMNLSHQIDQEKERAREKRRAPKKMRKKASLQKSWSKPLTKTRAKRAREETTLDAANVSLPVSGGTNRLKTKPRSPAKRNSVEITESDATFATMSSIASTGNRFEESDDWTNLEDDRIDRIEKDTDEIKEEINQMLKGLEVHEQLRKDVKTILDKFKGQEKLRKDVSKILLKLRNQSKLKDDVRTVIEKLKRQEKFKNQAEGHIDKHNKGKKAKRRKKSCVNY